MPEQSNDYRVVVFGSGSVGKTSLVLRFVKGTFRETYTPTVEDSYRQMLNCDKNICTLQITDTAGSHHFPAMQRLSITRGHAFLLVYSITSRQSFEDLKHIFEQIREVKEGVEDTPVLLVGNKCDEIDRVVSSKAGEEVAKMWGCGFIETSAKTNCNVKEMFQKLLSLEKRQTLTINDEPTDTKKKTLSRAERMKRSCIIY